MRRTMLLASLSSTSQGKFLDRGHFAPYKQNPATNKVNTHRFKDSTHFEELLSSIGTYSFDLPPGNDARD